MPERGDLLLVPFSFTDLSAAKRRPVLVITASDSYGDFIALPVTSRPQTAEAREIVEGLAVDFDAHGNVVGVDIDHASRKLDLSKVETVALPPADAAE